MYGLNAGYDSRTVESGDADTNIPVFDKQTIFFNQIALNAEAVSDGWTFNGYGLFPIGDVEQKLNSHYDAGALNTYGLDVGYFISPQLHASVGYYYQHRDQEDVDGSGVRGRLAYDITQGLTAGVNISYDEASDTRVSADLQVRFGGPSTTAAKKKKWENPTINALIASPENRDIRVHDFGEDYFDIDIQEPDRGLGDDDLSAPAPCPAPSPRGVQFQFPIPPYCRWLWSLND